MASDKGAQSLNSSAGYTQVVLYTVLYFSQHGDKEMFLLVSELFMNTSAFHQSFNPVPFA